MTARIVLKQDQASAIRAAALAAYPFECCGLLVGQGDTVARIVPTPNSASDPARHFEIDPQILFDHMRSARESSMQIVGHYHSHPNGRAEPSAQDIRMMAEPAVWVIAAVTEGQVSLRAFAPADGGFREIPIEV